jgi:hypothetical protein
MLSVVTTPIMLSVIMLNVVMLSVVAPLTLAREKWVSLAPVPCTTWSIFRLQLWHTHFEIREIRWLGLHKYQVMQVSSHTYITKLNFIILNLSLHWQNFWLHCRQAKTFVTTALGFLPAVHCQWDCFTHKHHFK